MSVRRMPAAFAFVFALLVASVAGSVVQTQINLASLSALGIAVPVATRLAATTHDLMHFAPLFALLVAPVLAGGLALARLSAGIRPQHRVAFTLVLPVLLMFAVLATVLAVPAVPAVIAAARTVTGMALISLAMAPAGWLWNWRAGTLR